MNRNLFILASLLFLLSSPSRSQSSFDPKQFGQEILDEKSKPKANSKTYQALDSLFCKNAADKDFYFDVVVKIQEVSDDAIKAHLANLSSKYYLENTKEFIERSKKMKKPVVNRWLDFIAFDIYVFNEKETDMSVIKTKLKKVLDKHSDLPAKDKAILKKYNEYLFKKAGELIKSQARP